MFWSRDIGPKTKLAIIGIALISWVILALDLMGHIGG